MHVEEATERLELLRNATQEALNVVCVDDDDNAQATLEKYVQALDVALNALAGCLPGPSDDVLITMADEAWVERLRDDDRQLFVRNLGWLLSQTRCGVVSCELYGDQDREYVIARYDHGGKREIDVTVDSYLAIVRDVARHV